MSPHHRRQREELSRELEADILPRQLRALERVAERLEEARPTPEPDFRARLGEEIGDLSGTSVGIERGPVTSWVLPALGAVALGLALLAAAAALAL